MKNVIYTVVRNDSDPISVSRAEWEEHCQLMDWEPGTPFFMPSSGRLYKTREAAQGRADLINRWGGDAVVMATRAVWVELEEFELRQVIDDKRAEAERLGQEASSLESRLIAKELNRMGVTTHVA